MLMIIFIDRIGITYQVGLHLRFNEAESQNWQTEHMLPIQMYQQIKNKKKLVFQRQGQVQNLYN